MMLVIKSVYRRHKGRLGGNGEKGFGGREGDSQPTTAFGQERTAIQSFPKRSLNLSGKLNLGSFICGR